MEKDVMVKIKRRARETRQLPYARYVLRTCSSPVCPTGLDTYVSAQQGKEFYLFSKTCG